MSAHNPKTQNRLCIHCKKQVPVVLNRSYDAMYVFVSHLQKARGSKQPEFCPMSGKFPVR